MKANLDEILTHYQFDDAIDEIVAFGCGHINETYRITCRNGKRYILQQINHHVFPNVPALMQNMVSVTSYLKEKVIAAAGDADRECMQLLFTTDSKSYIQDENGNYWRILCYIKGSMTLQTVAEPIHFYYSARAFGHFQKLLDGYPADTLFEVIPHFHDTVFRFADFEKAVADNLAGRVGMVAPEIAFVRAREDDTHLVVDLLKAGKLPLRVTHNDTKLNNVMLDEKTGEPLAVIDLDTVMSGSVLYDFGDSIRFGANPAAEDEKDLSKVCCDLSLFEEYVRGYLEECGDMLTDEEIRLLPFSAKLLTLECGIRFLTDFLNGDTYFRTERENQNLDRCRTQFTMVADIEKKLPAMDTIVAKYAR